MDLEMMDVDDGDGELEEAATRASRRSFTEDNRESNCDTSLSHPPLHHQHEKHQKVRKVITAKRRVKSQLVLVLDTNILLSNLNLVKSLILTRRRDVSRFRLSPSKILVPYAVIQELDGLKHSAEQSRPASNAIRLVNEQISAQNGLLKGSKELDSKHTRDKLNDDRILDACLEEKRCNSNVPTRVILLTDDVNFRTKAKIHEVETYSSEEFVAKFQHSNSKQTPVNNSNDTHPHSSNPKRLKSSSFSKATLYYSTSSPSSYSNSHQENLEGSSNNNQNIKTDSFSPKQSYSSNLSKNLISKSTAVNTKSLNSDTKKVKDLSISNIELYYSTSSPSNSNQENLKVSSNDESMRTVGESLSSKPTYSKPSQSSKSSPAKKLKWNHETTWPRCTPERASIAVKAAMSPAQHVSQIGQSPASSRDASSSPTSKPEVLSTVSSCTIDLDLKYELEQRLIELIISRMQEVYGKELWKHMVPASFKPQNTSLVEAIRIFKSNWIGVFSDLFNRDRKVLELANQLHSNLHKKLNLKESQFNELCKQLLQRLQLSNNK